MTSTILALDLGTTTGWAIRAASDPITHGFITFRPQRFEGGGMRYLRFKRWLSELSTSTVAIHEVYFEEVRRHAGVDAAHVYGGLMATLTTRGAGGHDQKTRNWQRQCQQGGHDRSDPHPGIPGHRRQRGRCAGAVALGHRDAGGLT